MLSSVRVPSKLPAVNNCFRLPHRSNIIDWFFTVYYCSKSILEEYCEISSLLTEEIVKVHQEISAAVEQIDPLVEYQHFIDAYRSESELVRKL